LRAKLFHIFLQIATPNFARTPKVPSLSVAKSRWRTLRGFGKSFKSGTCPTIALASGITTNTIYLFANTPLDSSRDKLDFARERNTFKEREKGGGFNLPLTGGFWMLLLANICA
jgi:hypothetical protein